MFRYILRYRQPYLPIIRIMSSNGLPSLLRSSIDTKLDKPDWHAVDDCCAPPSSPPRPPSKPPRPPPALPAPELADLLTSCLARKLAIIVAKIGNIFLSCEAFKPVVCAALSTTVRLTSLEPKTCPKISLPFSVFTVSCPSAPLRKSLAP